jgi:hypothetical protein
MWCHTLLGDMIELNRKLCYGHQLVGKMASYQVWLADELQWSLYSRGLRLKLWPPTGTSSLCGLRLQLPVQVRRAETGHGAKRSNGTQYECNYLDYAYKRSNGPTTLCRTLKPWSRREHVTTESVSFLLLQLL